MRSDGRKQALSCHTISRFGAREPENGGADELPELLSRVALADPGEMYLV